jgi:hypothetical protein
MLDQPLRRDPPHCIIRIMNSFSATKSEGEGQSLSDFIHRCLTKLEFIGHDSQQSSHRAGKFPSGHWRRIVRPNSQMVSYGAFIAVTLFY